IQLRQNRSQSFASPTLAPAPILVNAGCPTCYQAAADLPGRLTRRGVMRDGRVDGTSGGGAADDELRREVQDLHRALPPADALEQQLRGLGAQLVVREANRGKRRPQPVDERHVV